MGLIRFTDNASPSSPFTSVVVESFSGRQVRLTVPYPMGCVIKSLRQPPSYKNTIRLKIIERVTRPTFGYIDWIKRISIDDAWFEDDTTDSNIAASTDDLPLRDTFEKSLKSGSESGDECYTPESESCSSEDEYNSDGEQPLLRMAPLSEGSSVDTVRETTRRSNKARELEDEFRRRLRRSLPYCIIGASLYALWPLLQVGTAFTKESESIAWNLVTKSSYHEVVHLLAGLMLFACWFRYFFVRDPKSISQEAVANRAWRRRSMESGRSKSIRTCSKLFLLCQFWACAELGYKTLKDTDTSDRSTFRHHIYLFYIIGFLYSELLHTGLAISGLCIPKLESQSNLAIWFPNVKQRLTVMGAMLGSLKGLFDITAYNRARPNVFEFEPWYEVYYACVKHVWIQACIQGFSMYLVCMIRQGSRKEEAEDLESEDSQSEDSGNQDSGSECSDSEYSASEYSNSEDSGSEDSQSEDSLSESEGGVELMHCRLAKG